MTWAAKQIVTPAGRKAVLMILGYTANNSGVSTASQERLARLSGMTEQALRPHLKALEDDGFVESQPRFRKNGRRAVNNYYLAIGDAFRFRRERSRKERLQEERDLADGILS